MSKQNVPNQRELIGSGFIIIPEQIDREEYINFCKATQQASILTIEGNYIPDVFILNHVMDELIYPPTFKDMGSQVVFVTMPFSSKPIIIGTIPKQGESRFIGEGDFNIKRSIGDSVIEISGSAKDGVLNIVLNTNSKSNLNIRCYGEDSVINIENDGKTQIKSSKNVTVQSFNDLNIETINIDGEKLSKIYLKDGKIILNEGAEPMLLGSITQQQLDILQSKVDLIINAIENGVPIPQDGGLGYQNSMKIILSTKQDADFSGIKSENCSLD